MTANILRIMAVAMLLMSCGGSRPVDWSDMPLQDTMPRPIGRWFATPTVCVDDTVVYTSAGCEPCPELQAMAAGITGPVVKDFCAYAHGICGNVTYQYIDNPASVRYADIPIRLYDGPYQAKSSASVQSELVAWLLLIGLTLTVANDISDEASIGNDVIGFDLSAYGDDVTSIVAEGFHTTPPPAAANYNGVCYYIAKHGRITATSVWINVTYAQLPGWGRPALESNLPLIVRHELGHALCGLNDNLPKDQYPNNPGLMSYVGMTYYMSADEEMVLKWLYECQ